MNKALNFTQETEPDVDTMNAIEHGLRAYNFTFAGSNELPSLWLIGRNDAGDVCAGLKGIAAWNWLFVSWLWVAESYRFKGYGSKLLAQAEAIAKERECAGAFLDTHSFQAPEFYKKHGYREFGRLDNFPKGHSRIWFAKTF